MKLTIKEWLEKHDNILSKSDSEVVKESQELKDTKIEISYFNQFMDN